MPDFAESRGEIRILCQINVLFRVNFENFYGTCRNLGPQGMFIGYEGGMNEGDRVEINFLLAASGSSLIEAWGRVVWVNTGPDRNMQMPEGFGVQFLGMTDESRRMIDRFISQGLPG